jgi:ATP-dependent protease HslVU (ClpYQ) ATPase subunit
MQQAGKYNGMIANAEKTQQSCSLSGDLREEVNRDLLPLFSGAVEALYSVLHTQHGKQQLVL